MASDWGRDITPVTMETLDNIGAFRSDLGHFCRWPCNAKSSNIKSNFTKSQLPLYFGMYPKPLKEQQKESIGKEMTNVSLSYNVRRTMGRKIETRMKERFKRKLSLCLQKDSDSEWIVQLNQLLWRNMIKVMTEVFCVLASVSSIPLWVHNSQSERSLAWRLVSDNNWKHLSTEQVWEASAAPWQREFSDSKAITTTVLIFSFTDFSHCQLSLFSCQESKGPGAFTRAGVKWAGERRE